MRDPRRIDRIVEKLRRVWKASPDLRLSQLVSNACCHALHENVEDIFYVEDRVTERGLDMMLTDNQQK